MSDNLLFGNQITKVTLSFFFPEGNKLSKTEASDFVLMHLPIIWRDFKHTSKEAIV